MKSATLETGSFDGEALAAACKALRKAGGVGGLSVSDGVWELAATFLGDGGARVVATRLLPTVRGRLIRLDLVESAAARDVARRLSDEAGLSEVVALADAGVSSEDLARGVALSMAEAIVGATFWEGATYALQAEAVDETTACATGKAALSFEGDAREVLRAVADALEATAGIREERPDLAFRVEVTDAGAEAVERREPLGEGRDRRDRERVLGHLVRARSGPAAPICGRLGLSELEFLRACADLTERGYVAISPAGRAGEPSGSPSLAPIPWQIANAAAALRRRPPAPEQAGRHLARAANLLQAAGATRRAAQLAGEAAVAAPHDLEALVVAVHTAWSTGSRDRAAELSEPLARRLLALGLPARARDVLERAIAHRPAAALRELLVDVLERQGDDEAMAAVGREWVEGLRDEGRADDARAAAGRLMTVSGGAEREQLLRAAGVDRRKVVALLAVGAVIAGLYGPAKARGEARASYRSAVESAHSSLATSNSLAAATNVLDGLKTQFADLAAKAEQGLVGAPQVAARAREVAERIEAIRTDALAAHALLPHLPWRDAPDFEFLEDQVASLRKRARTDALREPLRALEKEMRAFREAAEADRRRLGLQRPSPEALELARSMSARFAAMPKLLAQSTLPVAIETSPPEAAVEFDGVPFSQRTPLTVRLPLSAGEHRLILRLAGHDTVEQSLSLETLGEAPLVSVELHAHGRPTRHPPQPHPEEQPEQPTPAPVGVSGSRPKPTPPPARPRAPQVAFLDGYVPGGRPRDLAFEGTPDRFASIRLKATYRARIQAVNVIEDRHVYLTGFRVLLYARGRDRWIAERPQLVELDDRRERPVVALGGGRGRRVQKLSRTHGLDAAEVDRRVRAALVTAIRIVVNRERGRR